jgi:hypothetical protein
MDDERRIPPFAEDTFALLTEAVGETGGGLPKDEATAVLTADERFSEPDAEEALTQLESRGHIYFVGETIRITPTDD